MAISILAKYKSIRKEKLSDTARDVLDKMREAFPNDWYWAEERQYYCYFDTQLKDGIYLSEDYYFCDRWRMLGGEVHAAFWTRCVHWGTYGFNGNLVNANYSSMEKKPIIPQPNSSSPSPSPSPPIQTINPDQKKEITKDIPLRSISSASSAFPIFQV